jgi:hypothetical protein
MNTKRKAVDLMTHTERIDYLENLDRETISPRELAMLIGGDQYYYNIAAKTGNFTLPYIWRGRNLRIFRQPVLDLIRGHKENPSQ